jgi:hypothetical protein
MHIEKKSSRPVYVVAVASKQDGASPAFLLEGAHCYLNLPDRISCCVRLNPNVQEQLVGEGQFPRNCVMLPAQQHHRVVCDLRCICGTKYRVHLYQQIQAATFQVVAR